MKKVKKLIPGGVYIIRGLASANSLEFENKSEVKLHLELFDHYMKNYVRVVDYILTKDGWEYLVIIKDKRTLQKYIDIDSNAKSKNEWDVTRIIGERIRVFRLILRRELNKIQGRKGSGVRNTFEKFHFENESEARDYIFRMRSMDIDLSQPKKKYKPDSGQFDVNGKLLKGWEYGVSILSSMSFREMGKKWMFKIHNLKLKVLDLLVDSEDIVNLLLNKVLTSYINPPTPTHNP